MRTSQVYFFSAFFLLFAMFFGHSQKKTNLALDKEGIKIYLTKLDTTPFKEYRAIMTVKANIDTVAKQILDIKSLQKWNFKTRKCELIRKVSDTSWIFYIEPSFGVAGSGSGSCFESYVNKKKSSNRLLLFSQPTMC